MRIRRPISRFFLVVGILFAVAFIIVQSVDDTRDGIAAQVTKPFPAGCAAIACFICFASVRIGSSSDEDEEKRERSSRNKHEAIAYEDTGRGRRNRCQIDIWCIMFAVAFVLFAVGDSLLMAHDVVIEEEATLHSSDSSSEDVPLRAEKMGISGIAMFAAGQMLILIAMCVPREVNDREQYFSIQVGVAYALLAIALWLATVFGIAGACHASVGTSALLATYLAIVIGVAWRSVDVFWYTRQTGSVLVMVGAHLFLVSDCMVGLRTLCAIPHDLSLYYPLVMTTYYTAIILEAWGVSKYALETAAIFFDAEKYSA